MTVPAPQSKVVKIPILGPYNPVEFYEELERKYVYNPDGSINPVPQWVPYLAVRVLPEKRP